METTLSAAEGDSQACEVRVLCQEKGYDLALGVFLSGDAGAHMRTELEMKEQPWES